ncbi:hypothetical protein VTK73DRAFT_4114 [Phialemonium thermophilum]|uniref:Uncharacterized protein n=1 Tax=Phialemonium thermophilum TaxID=223376 RepID=A0ABR3VCB8_9PEZI
MVVAQSIYTAQNARVQRAAMGLGAGGADEGTTRFLSEREASDAGRTTIAGAAKPWPLWVAEVQCHPLYKNEVHPMTAGVLLFWSR